MPEPTETEIVAGSDFVIDLPTPTTPAPTPEPEPQAAEAEPVDTPKQAVMVDSAGVEYDPEEHIPKTHPRGGRWMPRKKGNRKRPSEPGSPRPTTAQAESREESFVALPKEPEPEPEIGESEPRAINLDAKTAAQTATAILHVVSMRVFGAGDGKFSADEVKTLNEAAFHVIDKRGVKLSPEWALVAAVATVFGSRMTTPKGLSLVEKWKTKISDWWTTRKARRAGRHVRKTQRQADGMGGSEDDGNAD